MIAVKKGFITDEQLIGAMSVQLQEDLAGRPHRLLGLILKEAGHMNAAQVSQVLAQMRFPMAFCLRQLAFRQHSGPQPHAVSSCEAGCGHSVSRLG